MFISESMLSKPPTINARRLPDGRAETRALTQQLGLFHRPPLAFGFRCLVRCLVRCLARCLIRSLVRWLLDQDIELI